jgi:uncharacterized membrane protein YeiH
MIYTLDILGTLAFAISGAFRAVKYELDLLGVLVLASVTGIAGGILRDVILGATPPTALVDHWYVLVCIIGGLAVFFAAPKIATRWDYVMLADAIGLSVFTAIGASKAELHDATHLTVVLMGMMTSCGGGIIRDLLVIEIPSILRSDFYASAALSGGVCFVLLGYLGIGEGTRFACTITVTLALRLLAMKYRLSLPRAKPLHASPSQIAKEKKNRRNK